MQELTKWIPAFTANTSISDDDFLKIYTIQVTALAESTRTAELNNALPNFYKYLEKIQPKSKIDNTSAGSGLRNIGQIFPNANIFASAFTPDKYSFAFDCIISALSETHDAGRDAALELAFERSKLSEAPMASQLIGTPNSGQILDLLDNRNAIAQFENERIFSNANVTEEGTHDFSENRLIYFYYAQSLHRLYVLMKLNDRVSILTVDYADGFEFALSGAKDLDDGYKIIQEEKIYKVIDQFFASDPTAPILVVPCSFLYQYPLDGDSDGTRNFLIDKYAFRYAFNLGEHGHLMPPQADHKMLCVSDPAVFTSVFPPVKYGLRERDSIMAKIGKSLKIDTLSGENANEDKVSAAFSQYDIIHFATHSYFIASDPYASGIVLSKGRNSDGLFTAYEVQQLLSKSRKMIDLVTLSSCNGAEGSLVSNGALGLTYTLINSGVKNVLSSTTKVDDRLGQQYMEVFYQDVAKGDDFATAARLAKLRLKKQYPSRVFWCNFNLYSR